MKAIAYIQNGLPLEHPDALVALDLPTPELRPHDLLVRVQALSVNPVDTKVRRLQPTDGPRVLGWDAAGVVQAVGEGVTHLQPGQSIACLSGTGGFGTHTIAPAALCMPLPPGFSHVDAAAFIMTYATSHHALVDRAQLKAGETVLVLGAAGGVGTSAIQIASCSASKFSKAADFKSSWSPRMRMRRETRGMGVVRLSPQSRRCKISGLSKADACTLHVQARWSLHAAPHVKS